MTDRLSRRGTFLVLYAMVSIVVGILNMAYLTAGPNPMQWVFLRMQARGPGEGFVESFLDGVMMDNPFPIFQICLVAPFILIALAFFRGRKLGVLYMVAFPVIGLVLTFIGPVLFANLGLATAVVGPSLIAWTCDGWCLYLGAQSQPVDGAS